MKCCKLIHQQALTTSHSFLNPIFFSLVAIDINNDTKASVLRGCLALILVFRCPLMAIVTFKAREKVAAAKQKIRERRERQEIEIRNAAARREIRHRLRSNEEISNRLPSNEETSC